MSELFLIFINMSISASWLVLAVLPLRLIMKRAPKWVNVILWGIVAIRLICPFSIESAMSLIPSAETIPMNIEMADVPSINSGVNIVNNAINPVISSFAPNPGDSANPLQIWIPALSVVWVSGMVTLFFYTLISYWRLRRKVDTAVIYKKNIFQSENVDSPFVLGIIKPRIYLPFHMDEQNMEHVVAHEQAHIRRKDHWWKPLGFLLLTIHWFNPLMWIAYVLLCRDIELACDEKVIKELGDEQRADYTQALVACSVNRRRIAACPIAFGEVGVKDRVKSVMNYKKPTFWIIVVAVISCVVVAVCFLTNPSEKEPEDAVERDAIGKTYLYEKDGFMGGAFKITLYDDGTFAYYEGPASSYLGFGTWSQDVNTITLSDDDEVGYPFVNHFSIDGDSLVFIEEGSSNFLYVKVANGERFDLTGNVYKPNNKNEMILAAGEVRQEIEFPSEQAATEEDAIDVAINKAILNHFASDKPDGLLHCASFVSLAQQELCIDSEPPIPMQLIVYGMALHEKYGFDGGTLHVVESWFNPVKFTFEETEQGAYCLINAWFPEYPAISAEQHQNDIYAQFSTHSEDLANSVLFALLDGNYLAELKQDSYAQAVCYSGVDTYSAVEQLFEVIESSPTSSSKPSDYLIAHPEEYKELIYYGSYTLEYIFSEFLEGGQTGLRGQLMRIVLDDLVPEAQLRLHAETGQEYFDEWKAAAVRVSEQHDMDWIEQKQPAIFLLLQ